MASQKKVVIRQFDGTLFWGYLPALAILKGEEIQLLDTTGRVHPVPIRLVKTIAYVQDFNLDDKRDPERLGRRSFAAKPRIEGLWLKLEFIDRDTLEGLAVFDALMMDHLVDDRSLAVTPPDLKSNTYKLLIPRGGLANVEVLGLLELRPISAKPTRRSRVSSLVCSKTEERSLVYNREDEAA